MDFENWREIPILIYILLLAFLGGIVASIDEQRKDGKTIPLYTRFFTMLINGVVSGFAGMMMYFLYTFIVQSNEPTPFMFFLVGVTGWLGGGAMSFFIAIWKAFIQTQTKGDDK